MEAERPAGDVSLLFTTASRPHMSPTAPLLIDRYVRPTLAGEMIGSLAVTEPGGGSDVAGITTRAVRDGDRYIVNGAKTFITSGVRADFVTTAVRTGGPGHGGISILVVDTDTPGFTVTRALRKMGWHCSDTAELSYVDVEVPADNLVGEEGRGFVYIAEQFVVERIFLALMGYGRARGSPAASTADRVTFGSPGGNSRAGKLVRCTARSPSYTCTLGSPPSSPSGVIARRACPKPPSTPQSHHQRRCSCSALLLPARHRGRTPLRRPPSHRRRIHQY